MHYGYSKTTRGHYVGQGDAEQKKLIKDDDENNKRAKDHINRSGLGVVRDDYKHDGDNNSAPPTPNIIEGVWNKNHLERPNMITRPGENGKLGYQSAELRTASGVEYTIEFNEGKFEYARRTKWDKELGEIVEEIWTSDREKIFIAEFNYKKYFLNRQHFDDAFTETNVYMFNEEKFIHYEPYPSDKRNPDFGKKPLRSDQAVKIYFKNNAFFPCELFKFDDKG